MVTALIIVGCAIGGVVVGGGIGAVVGMALFPPGDIGIGTTEGLFLGGAAGAVLGAILGVVVGVVVI